MIKERFQLLSGLVDEDNLEEYKNKSFQDLLEQKDEDLEEFKDHIILIETDEQRWDQLTGTCESKPIITNEKVIVENHDKKNIYDSKQLILNKNQIYALYDLKYGLESDLIGNIALVSEMLNRDLIDYNSSGEYIITKKGLVALQYNINEDGGAGKWFYRRTEKPEPVFKKYDEEQGVNMNFFPEPKPNGFQFVEYDETFQKIKSEYEDPLDLKEAEEEKDYFAKFFEKHLKNV